MQRYNNYTIIKISITKIENTICPTALDKLDEKWGEKYPIVIKPWRDNWDRLSEFTICPVLKEGYILLLSLCIQCIQIYNKSTGYRNRRNLIMKPQNHVFGNQCNGDFDCPLTLFCLAGRGCRPHIRSVPGFGGSACWMNESRNGVSGQGQDVVLWKDREALLDGVFRVLSLQSA